MKIKIKFLNPFSKIVGKSKLKIDFKGITFEDLLTLLVNNYPKLKNEFYTKNNELSDHICIFLNDKPISALNGIKTEVKNNDELIFFIPISGG
jgi:MoaD family protein